MTTFESLGLSPALLRALEAAAYQTATPIQHQSIPSIAAGRDLVGCAQTGTGKTAAFALPTLQRLMKGTQPNNHGRRGSRQIRALILAPTRELAGQINDSFARYGKFTHLRSTVIYGGVGQGPQVRALKAGVDILVATPGRLLDLIGQGYVRLDAVEVLILDEADRMLDMGFIHDLRKIVAHVPAKRQTLMFSATMPEPIRRLIVDWMKKPVHVEVTPNASTPEKVEQSVFFVEPREKSKLLSQLLRQSSCARTLVFTRTKRGADRVARSLRDSGIRAISIHGEKSQGARQAAIVEFNAAEPPVLVATDIAARGLNILGISHVVNYDLPEVPETYIHRIGRTARAGAAGCAISFCGGEERSRLKMIERLMGRSVPVERTPRAARQSHEEVTSPEPPAVERPTGRKVNKSRRPNGVAFSERSKKRYRKRTTQGTRKPDGRKPRPRS